MIEQKALEGWRLGQQDGGQTEGLGGCSLDDPLLRVEGGQGVQAQPVHHLERKRLVTDSHPSPPPCRRKATEGPVPRSSRRHSPRTQPVCGECGRAQPATLSPSRSPAHRWLPSKLSPPGRAPSPEQAPRPSVHFLTHPPAVSLHRDTEAQGGELPIRSLSCWPRSEPHGPPHVSLRCPHVQELLADGPTTLPLRTRFCLLRCRQLTSS